MITKTEWNTLQDKQKYLMIVKALRQSSEAKEMAEDLLRRVTILEELSPINSS